MNRVEVFEKVKAHLLEQNCKSLDGTLCVFRGKNNRKCALGILILDADYNSQVERTSIQDLVKEGILPDVGIDLLNYLQYIHDELDTDEWAAKLDELWQLLRAAGTAESLFGFT